MLQISMPYGGDELNLTIVDNLQSKTAGLIDSYLSDFVASAKKQLDITDHRSGLAKLKNVAKQSEAYLPWIVTSYANFYIHCLNYQNTDFELELPADSTILNNEMLVELTDHVAQIGPELFTPFLLLGAESLARNASARNILISTRDWNFVTANQELVLLNPLTDTEIEFSIQNSTYLKLDVDSARQTCYVYSSIFLADLGALQLDLRHGSGRAVASDTFLSQHELNKCWLLDSDNLVSPLVPEHADSI